MCDLPCIRVTHCNDTRSAACAPGTWLRATSRAASASRPPTPHAARSSRLATWNGTSLVCDSQYVEYTCHPRCEARFAVSATILLFPIPGGPTTLTTHPRPLIDRSSIAVRAVISHSRPTNVDVRAAVSGRRPVTEISSYAGTGASAPLIRTSRRSLRTASRATSRAVDSLTMTPHADATDSMRCAIPT